MKTVAVLGAGNSGKTLAADAALAGHEVRLFEFPEYAASIRNLRKTRKIRVVGKQVNAEGFVREGVVILDHVGSDMAKVVSGADIIAVSVRALSYEKLFGALVPHLEDGQVVAIFPDNFGSFVLRKKIAESGRRVQVTVGGWSSLPYGCRVIRDHDISEVNIIYRAVNLRGDALPSSDRSVFFDAMQEFAPMDTVDPIAGDTMVDVGFCNVNPILHVPAVLLNLGAIDNWGVIDHVGSRDVYFNIYRHGFSEHVSKVQYAIYLEELEIAEKMGIELQKYDRKVFFSRLGILGPEFMGEGYTTPLEQNMPDFYQPVYFPGERFSPQSRYITEDIPVGCHLFYQFAKRFGVKVPVIESMIRLGSTVSGVDYFSKGMTLKDLGVENMSNDELLRFLREGDQLLMP
ncbi:MAG: NAD/NADP octopine/nopaline dehydrogenase family protein [Synergistota bacterium]|nr:NAD/NADP octopine/nopaline dehydrogenase family protein [Synergistota bacterium]